MLSQAGGKFCLTRTYVARYCDVPEFAFHRIKLMENQGNAVKGA